MQTVKVIFALKEQTSMAFFDALVNDEFNQEFWLPLDQEYADFCAMYMAGGEL